MPQVQAGAVRALAVSSKQRQSFHPEVPSVLETGVAQLDMESWFGLFAPAGTEPQVLERLRKEFAAVIALPEVAEPAQEPVDGPCACRLRRPRA